jgi:hypothetical protein
MNIRNLSAALMVAASLVVAPAFAQSGVGLRWSIAFIIRR